MNNFKCLNISQICMRYITFTITHTRVRHIRALQKLNHLFFYTHDNIHHDLIFALSYIHFQLIHIYIHLTHVELKILNLLLLMLN